MKTLDFKKELIDGLIKNDRSAQYEFYHTYSKAMYNICLRMLGNEPDAEDILQGSFMDAYTNIKSYNFQSTPGAWLKRIVINNCINQIRKRKISLVEMQEGMDKADEPDVDHLSLNMTDIRQAISQLPNGYRVVLTLYLMEGYDHIEIGEILGISSSTSKSQYSRARKKLKEIILKKNINIYES